MQRVIDYEPMAEWKVSHVKFWLNSFPNLSKHAATFEAEGVAGEDLLELSKSILTELGVSLLHGKKILREVAKQKR
jgi:hypothetical protein